MILSQISLILTKYKEILPGFTIVNNLILMLMTMMILMENLLIFKRLHLLNSSKGPIVYYITGGAVVLIEGFVF